MKRFALIAVVLASTVAYASPAGWEQGFLERYEGRPTTRAEAVEKIERFSGNARQETATYLVSKLAASVQGRAFLFQMSDDMDKFAKGRIASGFSGDVRTAIENADGDYSTDPTQTMPGEISDATGEIPQD